MNQSEEQYRQLAEAIPQIVWTARPDGWIDYYNQQWFDYTGMTLEQSQGWGWGQMLHPDDVQSCLDRWTTSVETGENYEVECRIKRTSDQTYRWHLTRAVPVRDTEGKILKWFSSSTDINDQKLALETLQAANTRLKDLAALRDEFVAKVSHELRTPLTAIKEGVSLILDQALGPINGEQRDFLVTVDRDTDRLSDLIGNMLDLSKLEAGRLRLSRRRVAVHRLIESAIDGYKAVAEGRTITAQLPVVTDIFVDPRRILQVITNLFSNAVKFTKEGGHITFDVHEQDESVAVSIQDDGVGIAQDDLTKVFKKFSQVGEGEQRLRGTGLGLALCKELVELHRGTLSVSSVPGRGSRFTVSLPMYTANVVLEESFKELLEAARRNQQEAVALIVLDCAILDIQRNGSSRNITAADTSTEPPKARIERLERIAGLIRQYVSRRDIVLSIEPRWVVLLAITDVGGAAAIIKRLSAMMLGDATTNGHGCAASVGLRFGVGTYPIDGVDVHGLFAKSTDMLGRDIAKAERTALGGKG